MFNFGEHLKNLRNSKSHTQKHLAAVIGVAERNYQRYEANVQKPSYDNLLSLANYFDCSVDYLMGRTENPRINF